MPWDAQTETIGRAVGREERAQELVHTVDAKFEEFRTAHPDIVGKTAVLAYGGPDGYGAYSSQDTRSRFFTDLGLKMPPKIDELAGTSFYVQLSRERFRLLDQQLVVMFGAQDDVLADPVFRRLKAVQEDRVIYLDLGDQFAGALGFSSALSLPFLVDEAEPMLEAALDGDTATKVDQPE
jgi:iron complex transport system substrate-binding protein